MRLRVSLLALVAALAGAASAAQPVEFLSGQLLVKVKPGQRAAANAAYKRIGAIVVSTIPQIGWEKIKLKSGMTVQTAANSLKKPSVFISLEPNGKLVKFETTNDPLRTQQYSLARMQVNEAWDVAKADRDVIVAIIDDGVDSRHPDLQGRVLPGYDFSENDTDTINRSPSESHGTHVAGIAAASTNNGVGIAGVAYNASILPIQVFGADGGGSWDWLAQGLVFAADRGAHVANMSLGGTYDSPAVRDAIAYAHSKNVLLVAAAGNDNVSGLHYPGAYEDVICVGSSDQNDAKSGFSNYGADWVDVAAPGSGILSTVTGNSYQNYDGTSMASPNVAGVAALVIGAAGPGALTNDEVRAIIEGSCDAISGGWIAKGRVNAYRAVLATPLPLSDTPATYNILAMDGTLSGGDSTTLATGDGISATIQGVKRTSIGMVGSMTATFAAPTAMSTDSIRTATLKLTAKVDPLAVLQVYFWNPATSKWALYTTRAGSATSGITLKMDRSKILGYMDAGEVKIMLRSYVPTRLMNRVSSVTTIDQAQMSYTGRVVSSQP